MAEHGASSFPLWDEQALDWCCCHKVTGMEIKSSHTGKELRLRMRKWKRPDVLPLLVSAL